MGKRLRRRKVNLGAAFIVLALIWYGYTDPVHATEKSTNGETLNIVIAVDHSGSMNRQDGQKTVPEMIKALSDTLCAENVRIGYVAYNDTILTGLSPVPVETREQRGRLQETVKSSGYSGETDVGLGMAEAYRLLEDCAGKKMLVLISDGKTDLERSKTGRTPEESQKDMESVIDSCRQEGTPVVTIAFGKDYEGDGRDLADMSEQTGGLFFTAANPDELVGIFYNLSDYIEKRNVTAKIEWTDKVTKNQPAVFRIFLTDGGNVVQNVESFRKADWYADFYNIQTGSTIPVKLKWEGNSLAGTVTLKESGKYTVLAGTGQNRGNLYGTFETEVMNTMPVSLISDEFSLYLTDRERSVDLNACFTDADGDELTYTVENSPETAAVRIDGNYLYITPEAAGEGCIAVKVSDGENNLISQISIRVKSPYPYWIGAGITFILILLLAARLATRRQKQGIVPKAETGPGIDTRGYSFTGKLNAYFTLLPKEGEEIPPLSFALHQIREKKIALDTMFKNYPEETDLLGLDKIFLFPAENRRMILYHNSNAAVMLGNSIVCRNMQYAVSYGDILYITAADRSCELEIHYISMLQ